jgi:hypothetical protein
VNPISLHQGRSEPAIAAIRVVIALLVLLVARAQPEIAGGYHRALMMFSGSYLL